MKLFVFLLISSLSLVKQTQEAPLGDEVENQWETWKEKHGRLYQDDEEELRRFSIWKDNLDKVSHLFLTFCV